MDEKKPSTIRTCHICGLFYLTSDLQENKCPSCFQYTQDNPTLNLDEILLHTALKGIQNLKIENVDYILQNIEKYLLKNPILGRVNTTSLERDVQIIISRLDSLLRIKKYLPLMEKYIQVGTIEFNFEIFISHVWDDFGSIGQDKQVVQPLVELLKAHGYEIWYDRDKFGKEPGDVEQIITAAISSSNVIIPILCKRYFDSKNCQFELKKMLELQKKDNKIIIPIWWSDIDEEYIKSSNFDYPLEILTQNYIPWNAYQHDIHILFNQIETIIEKLQGNIEYKGAKIKAGQAAVLQDLEKIIGEEIPNTKTSVKFNPEFGFTAENGNITKLILRDSGTKKIPPLTLPNSFMKLKSLEELNAPLINLPENIHWFSSLKKLYISGGKLETIPKKIVELINLKECELQCNPYVKIDQNTLRFIHNNFYPSWDYSILSIEEERNTLFLLELIIGKKIPQDFDKNYDFHRGFGFFMEGGCVIKLSLASDVMESSIHKFITLPENIGELRSLQELHVNHNELVYLPDDIGKLHSLEKLYLHYNKLNQIPESIWNLQSLKTLVLDGNCFKDLPECMGNCQSLETLCIRSNGLETIPNSIGHLKSLRDLYIEYNNLSTLPETLANLPLLSNLNFQYNPICNESSEIKWLKKLENKGC